MKPILERVTMILLFLFLTSTVVSQKKINFLKAVKMYQDSVKIVKPSQIPDIIDTTTFDIDKYLRIFNKLKLPPGLKCQYLYHDDQTSGYPILYIVKDTFDMESYLNREYIKRIRRDNIDTTTFTPKNTKFLKDVFVLDGFAYQNNAKKIIIPEDSKAGYLQYLFFNQFGEEFALKWHSNFGQKSVIFSKSELKRLYNYYLVSELFTFDRKEFETLLNGNIRPIIVMNKNSCLITWYEIMTHSGIYKRTYEISRALPYTIEQKENVKIIEINAEFIF